MGIIKLDDNNSFYRDIYKTNSAIVSFDLVRQCSGFKTQLGPTAMVLRNPKAMACVCLVLPTALPNEVKRYYSTICFINIAVK